MRKSTLEAHLKFLFFLIGKQSKNQQDKVQKLFAQARS